MRLQEAGSSRVGGNRFEPDKALTREQMAVLLDRLLNNDSDNDSDSDEHKWWRHRQWCKQR